MERYGSQAVAENLYEGDVLERKGIVTSHFEHARDPQISAYHYAEEARLKAQAEKPDLLRRENPYLPVHKQAANAPEKSSANAPEAKNSYEQSLKERFEAQQREPSANEGQDYDRDNDYDSSR